MSGIGNTFWMRVDDEHHFTAGIDGKGDARLMNSHGAVSFPAGKTVGSYCTCDIEGDVFPGQLGGPLPEALVRMLPEHRLQITTKQVHGSVDDPAALEAAIETVRLLMSEHIGPETKPPGLERGVVAKPKKKILH